MATEKLRVQRFLKGLKSYLFRAIARHGDMTYDEALNRALTSERGNKDRGGNSRDSRKRFHSDTSRGGHQGHNVLEMIKVNLGEVNWEVDCHKSLKLVR